MSRLGTLGLVALYAAVLVCTNTRFTMLDDESNSIAIAGRTLTRGLLPFLIGSDVYRELHPPETEILWHVWMAATHHSFFLVRVLANVFFIGALLFTAGTAGRLAGRQAYWCTLLLGMAWPFAFQYGRIAGWYTLSTFLVSLLTWIYVQLLEDRDASRWVWFAAASVVLLWSNYFGLVFLALLLADMVIIHREVFVRRRRQVALTAVVVAAAFAPLVRVALSDAWGFIGANPSKLSVAREVAVVGYPVFAMAGSGAVAPWFWPLSVPVALAGIALTLATWHSDGRRWLLYGMAGMLAMDIARVFDVKRVLIFLPWLFLATGISLCKNETRWMRIGCGAVAVMILAGWIGIASGQHEATTNLHEPWAQVARVVAEDARHGATVISENPPFFFYMDYALGLQGEMQAADGADLGKDLYRAHGYTILDPDETAQQAQPQHGRVVLVNGSGVFADVEAMRKLQESFSLRCAQQGEYRAAPDPALPWKQRFIPDVPLLEYRADVTWFDCP